MTIKRQEWIFGNGHRHGCYALSFPPLSGQAEPEQEHPFFNDIGIGKIFSKDIEPSPEAKPYQLPTFNQLTEHYNDNIPALIPATMPDPDAVFHLVAACHPSKSLFNIDIDLKGQISDRGQMVNMRENEDYQSITSNYIAIVARMPLYSSTEMQRARDKETDRRKDTAKAVSDFIGAIAKRNHAIRHTPAGAVRQSGKTLANPGAKRHRAHR